MSSIDKYVESEARSINPHIRVQKVLGRIIGTIRGKVVFNIADRYGYLSDSERAQIRNSINMYEEEQREQARMEVQRRENERCEARDRLKQEMRRMQSNLQQSYANAESLYRRAIRSADLSAEMKELQGYNVQPYQERVDKLKAKVEAGLEQMQADYQAKSQELQRRASSIRDNSEKSVYEEQLRELRRVASSVSTSAINADEIEELKDELRQVSTMLKEVRKIEKNLRTVRGDGAIANIVKAALQEIQESRIASVEDVKALLSSLEDWLSLVDNLQFESRTAETARQVSTLRGDLEAIKALRVTLANYRKKEYRLISYREQIEEMAKKVLRSYASLEDAEYTTCTQERMQSVRDEVQAILVNGDSDEATLRLLEKRRDEAARYATEDRMQQENYADYKAKRQELLDGGMELKDIEPFDVKDYDKQKERLNGLLVAQDLERIAFSTRRGFYSACEAMDRMGYKMLASDWGIAEEGEDKSVAEQKALACEGVFVIPGCDDVLLQIIVSDGSMYRRLIGVQKTDGTSTSVDRIKEVAKQLEDTEEMQVFLDRYEEIDCSRVSIEGAVDLDSSNCDEQIEANGVRILTAEEEKFMAELVALGDEAQKQQWASKQQKTAVYERKAVQSSSRVVDRAREERKREAMERRYRYEEAPRARYQTKR